MHPNNKHKNGYDFEVLTETYPDLKAFIIKNKAGRPSINFGQAEAVKALNTAILKKDYQIDYWNIPKNNLCPPIPGRADYILYLNDLINEFLLNKKPVKILDIGTGANLIYPLLGCRLFHWQFTATDINKASLDNAHQIIKQNHLEDCIKTIWQPDPKKILKNILKPNDFYTASMCNPPFYDSPISAQKANNRKNKHLKLSNNQRNFKGIADELWTEGGELAFIKNYINESLSYQNQIKLFTSLVSNKKNIGKLIRHLKSLKIKKYDVLPISQGQKRIHIIHWRF